MILAIFTAVILAPTAIAKTPDRCSNLAGVQAKIPAGYKRGVGLKCIKKKPPGRLKSCPDGFKAGPGGSCQANPSPPPQPVNTPWWPSGYSGWTGAGSNSFVKGQSLVAYAPASCNTIGGGQVANGQPDSIGNICWAYTLEVNVVWGNGAAGCSSLFVKANEISNGVIVGDTIAEASSVPNNQPVLIHQSVRPQGYPGLTLQLTEIDCYSL